MPSSYDPPRFVFVFIIGPAPAGLFFCESFLLVFQILRDIKLYPIFAFAKRNAMPTILDLFGLKFIIFTADHLPPHCHVKSVNGGAAKFIIKDTVELVESTLRPKDLKLAEYVLEENIENIRNAWKQIHGDF